MNDIYNADKKCLNEIINKYANIIDGLKRENLAYYALVRELCPDDKTRVDLIEQFFIKFDLKFNRKRII